MIIYCIQFNFKQIEKNYKIEVYTSLHVRTIKTNKQKQFITLTQH